MLFFWKRLQFPTKLAKITCILTIVLSILIISYRLDFNSKLKQTEHRAIINLEMNQLSHEHGTFARPELKYILHWVNPKNRLMENNDGSLLFTTRNCAWKNCYVTDQSDLLKEFSNFNIVLFNAPDIDFFQNSLYRPQQRHSSQKFVFVSGDAAATHPVCDRMWNSYFNWTWTYNLSSEIVWRYFIIKDVKGNVIGPKKDMNWIRIQNMQPVDSKFIMQLRSKTRIAAWFVSNCSTESHREVFVKQLQTYLNEYNLEIDIYGACGKFRCPKETMSRCLKMLEEEYFFYMAFENALNEDFVTDIVLHALNHYTVPVVFGAANYTRFLPDGAYLNALQYGPEGLARRMFEIMQKPSLYQRFFRWRNHYSYHTHDASPDTDNYCHLCAAVNNKSFNDYSLRSNFTNWWTGDKNC